MTDPIDRDVAIDEISKYGSIWMEYTEDMSIHEVAECALKASKESMIRILRDLPSAQPEQKSLCTTCEGLKRGDTLYTSADWDGGIGFDYIWDIKFCPVCGRKL